MHTTVTIIGAGQAGLAMSRCLSELSIDHVVLERGEIANSWRTERWDSLRLLSPNWMTRLPGHRYEGLDPDGFMTGAEVVELLDDYRDRIQAPVRPHTDVVSVESTWPGFRTTTTTGVIESAAVVVATGACSTPRVPAVAGALPERIHQLTPIDYRNPERLPAGRTLVVGGSASGAQIADELRRHGRDVVLSVGDHVRLPRTYRGMDIHWWMDTVGLLDERFDEVDDLVRARRLPSLQLVGTPEKRTLDLNALSEGGVELVGRLAGVAGNTAQFSGSFANFCASADLKLDRLLDTIDRNATERGLDAELGPTERPRRTTVPTARTTVALADIETVIWATGFRPRYPWLEPDLLDRKGQIDHHGGVMRRPGMYVLGLPFTRRRKSSFIDGVGPDARDLSTHLAGHLDSIAAGLSR